MPSTCLSKLGALLLRSISILQKGLLTGQCTIAPSYLQMLPFLFCDKYQCVTLDSFRIFQRLTTGCKQYSFDTKDVSLSSFELLSIHFGTTRWFRQYSDSVTSRPGGQHEYHIFFLLGESRLLCVCISMLFSHLVSGHGHVQSNCPCLHKLWSLKDDKII